MRKSILSFALASLACGSVLSVSCQRLPGGSSSVLDEGRAVEVNVSIQGSAPSRVTEVTYSDESKVSGLQVFVFNGDDREAYRSVTGAMQALVPATAGLRTVCAVVNAPDLSSVMTLEGLNATVSALSDNAKDAFVMTGTVEQELTDGGSVVVTVKRLVSRVSIAKVSTAFVDYRENYRVRLDAMYLINVAANNSLDLTAGPTAWENRLEFVSGPCNGLLRDAISGVSVYNGHPYEKEHVFYAYPNPFPGQTADDYSPTWSPRGTILVLDVTLITDSQEQIHGYYPIILPALQRNKTYVIEEVCITRLPGDVPYKPIETGETQVTISVHEWETGLNLGVVTI